MAEESKGNLGNSLLPEDIMELFSKVKQANLANDKKEHWLLMYGRASYVSSLEKLTYLTWEQAEKAMDVGIRIGYADQDEDYHGSTEGLYPYNPLWERKSLHEFRENYDDYQNKVSQRYTRITIDPSYDWTGVVNTKRLKDMIEKYERVNEKNLCDVEDGSKGDEKKANVKLKNKRIKSR